MAGAVHDAVVALGHTLLALDNDSDGTYPYWEAVRGQGGTLFVRAGGTFGPFVVERTAHEQMAWAVTTRPVAEAFDNTLQALDASSGLSWLAREGQTFGLRVAPPHRPHLPIKVDVYLGHLHRAEDKLGPLTLAQMAALFQRAADKDGDVAHCGLFSTMHGGMPGDSRWEQTHALHEDSQAHPRALVALLPILEQRGITAIGKKVGSYGAQDVPPLNSDHTMEEALAPLWEAFEAAADELEPGIAGVRLVWDSSVHHHPIALHTLDGRVHDGRIWSLSNTERRDAILGVEKTWRALATAAIAHAPILGVNGAFAAGVRRAAGDAQPIGAARVWGIRTTPRLLTRLSGLTPSSTAYTVAHLTGKSSAHVVPASSPMEAAQRGLALTDAPPHLPQATVWRTLTSL